MPPQRASASAAHWRMSACAACAAASPVRPLRSPCGHVLCGRCGALRVCVAAPVCPACGTSLRQLEDPSASGELPAGTEARRVRYGHAEVTLRVRVGAGESTHDVVAATFGIPRQRLKLLAAGRVLSSEDEARAARSILAVGTPAGAQLPRVPAWRAALSWLGARASAAAGLVPPAARAAVGAWRLLGRAAGVAAHFAMSLLLPSHAPPVIPPD